MIALPPAGAVLEAEAFEVLRDTLGTFGEFEEHQWTGRRYGSPSPGFDLRLRFRPRSDSGGGQTWWIHVEIKSIIHPRQAREAIWGLKRGPSVQAHNEPIYRVLIGSHISGSVAAMCEAEGVGYLDLSGNCQLRFGGLWIERQGKERKYREKRGLQTIYSPEVDPEIRARS